MQTRSSSLLTAAIVGLATIGLAAIAQAQDKKVEVAGTYTWEQPGRGGGDPVKITLKLKQDGDKVTGSVSRPGRDGNTTETEIKDAKLKGDEISFTTSVERGGNTFTTKYNGKVGASSIKGKIEATGRDGNATQRDWEAKREVAKK